MRGIDLPGQVNAFIDLMGENTFVCAFCRKKMSDEWNVKNGVR